MKCPGQDSRYWKPDAVYEAKCPQCGIQVEFFKDDTTRKCTACGHRFLNPSMDFGCAAYCAHAADCIGNLPPELIAQQDNLLKDRVAVEMKKYFRKDFKRIGHAVKTARYAEHIGKKEGNIDLSVVLCAAYLHDVGSGETKKNQDDIGGKDREAEGPSVAREILKTLRAKPELIEEVCSIIGRRHHPRNDETPGFKVFFDAVRIADLEERYKDKPIDRDALEDILQTSFLTESGKDHGRTVLLKENRSVAPDDDSTIGKD